MRRPAVLILATLALSVAAAQQPRQPRFRYERAVQLAAAGPQRLDLDATLLAGGKPFTVTSAGDRRIAAGGLSDLRLFTSDNVEVPYVMVAPAQTEPAWMSGRILEVATVDTPTEKTSGFEVDLGEAALVDAVQLNGIRAPFLKRLRLEGSGDRERWTILIGEGTAFDLPGEALRQTLLAFDAGAYRYLRVTWDDTNSGRVAPPMSAQARRVQTPAPASPLRVPLMVERRPSEPRVSRFRVRLPGGRLPIAGLELSVGGEYLMRTASVSEARFTGQQAIPQIIGRTTLRRVMREGIAADALTIPVQQPIEAQLDLVVDDGDNPPLDLQGVTAVFAALPWIYFEASAPGEVVARYGDVALQAPQYDLEAARQNIARMMTTPAVWGPAQARAPEPDDVPLPLPETGGSVDVSAFEYSRAIAAAPGGLVSIPLDAAVLAHSAGGARLPDVRIVDARGRQIPYLLERRDEPIALDVRVERRELSIPSAERPGRSTYVVHLPYQVLPGGRVAVETRARVFQRDVTLGQIRPADDRQREPRVETLAATRWVHAEQDISAPPLMFDVPERRAGDIVLLIEEGDNQPLPIDRTRLLLPSYAARLYQPDNQALRLLYGSRELTPPQYDLALLAPQVMGSPAREAYAGAEQPGGASQAASNFIPPPVFWGSLAAAVVVLLGVIVRLMRKTDVAPRPT
jgi:hypothetical protein